ncbi:unnamed protein product [Bursaphelenchus okinawaensis]|uniref:Rho-GAP domain-containing protein n=1 Tax=Bursaphelenchus okinawaensis TaxID=465554 RepID=A0A811KT40_9BILA|nr:unnamed protein product [Bursaphelenchus okinawaensis]CAG9112237.1 unnamed protein product [Bursaphelenchus okinawaensis]
MSNRKRSIEVTTQEVLDMVNESVSSAKKILLESSFENTSFCREGKAPLAEIEPEIIDFDEELESPEKKPEKRTIRNKLRRSISVPHLLDTGETKAPPAQRRATTTIVPPAINEVKDISLSNWDSFDASRSHDFVNLRIKNVLTTVECSFCNSPIKFGTTSKKCNACRLYFHPDCTPNMIVPCLPRKETPKSAYGKGRLRLGDYCPDNRPMIPHIIGHCVVFLERSKISNDLYEGIGDDENSLKLVNLFKKNKCVPKLSDSQPNDIAGCIKRFLSEIRDPLIPFADASDFIVAESEGNEDKLLELVGGLPNPHCDTLVCLIKHWKRLGEESFHGAISQDEMSKRVGPTIMGAHRASAQVTEAESINVTRSLMQISMEKWDAIETEANAQQNLPRKNSNNHELCRFMSTNNILAS